MYKSLKFHMNLHRYAKMFAICTPCLLQFTFLFYDLLSSPYFFANLWGRGSWRVFRCGYWDKYLCIRIFSHKPVVSCTVHIYIVYTHVYKDILHRIYIHIYIPHGPFPMPDWLWKWKAVCSWQVFLKLESLSLAA